MAKSLGRKILKVLLGLVGILLVGVAGLVIFVKARADRKFELPATGISSSKDPAVVARGEYLFHGPMHCTACHVLGGMQAYLAGKPGDRLNPWGGQEWKMGPLGTLRAANLSSDTETGIGARSDEHLARVIKHGLREDGHLSPMMSLAVPPASDDDITALVSYLRTLGSHKNAVAPNELGILSQALLAFGVFAPRTTSPPEFVRESDQPSVARGRYLAHGPAMCAACHSPYDFMDGMKLKGALFSGCHKADPAKDAPDKEICAPNLTTHPTAGRLTGWNEELFLARMKTGKGPVESIMPWLNFANMTDSDLRSVFMYLMTVPQSDRNTGPSVRAKGWKPEG